MQIQGGTLAQVLREARDLPGAPLVSLDLNGVAPGDTARHQAILGPALPSVDVLHANLEEAQAIVGLSQAVSDDEDLRALAKWFLDKGVAIVAITLGAQGSFAAVTGDPERLKAASPLHRSAGAWVGQNLRAAAFSPGAGSTINANGAGDSFVGGLVLAAAAWKEKLTLDQAVSFAALAALQRVDGNLRDAKVKHTAAELMAKVKVGGAALPPRLPLR